jgi:hypothetical protein
MRHTKDIITQVSTIERESSKNSNTASSNSTHALSPKVKIHNHTTHNCYGTFAFNYTTSNVKFARSDIAVRLLVRKIKACRG